MKKIMFSDRLGLTDAVLECYKTMTRRVIQLPDSLSPNDVWNPVMGIDDKGKVYFSFDCIDGKKRDVYPTYQIGEEVAIAQRYKDIPIEKMMKLRADGKTDRWPFEDLVKQSKGYTNKMFVISSLMPNRIRITNISAERLQDISDDDCVREGIIPFTWRQWLKQGFEDALSPKYKDWDVWTLPKFIESLSDAWSESDPEEFMAESPKVAFYVIIRKLMSKKVWDENPWVFPYEFKLTR